MVSQSNECDRNRLSKLLHDELPSPQLNETHRHLETCDACRSELESLAADKLVWRELPRFLQQDDSDPETPLPHNMQSGFEAGHDPASTQAAELVLTRLARSDNPAMLGRIGEYDILEVIGCGGMGVVLKGYDRNLNRFVAIKVLAPHYASSGAARNRFTREAKAAAAVVHPHVVAIHCVADADGLPYLVMQFVPGKSLQQRIDADAPLPLEDVLRIGMQAALGLAAAHAQGLVHRDVKPANILLENGVERVLLGDFGLAHTVDDVNVTQSGVLVGTPQFMSPEQARGEAVDARSDLFSLGSVLYAMCTRHPPFRAESTFGVLNRIQNETPQPVSQFNSDVPKWLEGIIERLLAKEPGDRIQTAAEVADELEKWLAYVQQPGLKPKPTPERKPPQASRQRSSGTWRRVLSLAGGLLLVVGAVVIVLELNKGTLRIQSADDGVRVQIMKGSEVYKTMTVTQHEASIRVAAGKYVVTIDGEHDGLIVDNGAVTVTRGDTQLVRIVREEMSDAVATPTDKRPVPSVVAIQRLWERIQGVWIGTNIHGGEPLVRLDESTKLELAITGTEFTAAMRASDGSVKRDFAGIMALRPSKSPPQFQMMLLSENRERGALYGTYKIDEDTLVLTVTTASGFAVDELPRGLPAVWQFERQTAEEKSATSDDSGCGAQDEVDQEPISQTAEAAGERGSTKRAAGQQTKTKSRTALKVRAQVVDPDGNPVEGADVMVGVPGGSDRPWRQLAAAATDGDGNCQFALAVGDVEPRGKSISMLAVVAQKTAFRFSMADDRDPRQSDARAGSRSQTG